VILVVYLFLQGWRATLDPLLAVPVSLLGTFVFFPLSASPSIRFLSVVSSWRSALWWTTPSSWSRRGTAHRGGPDSQERGIWKEWKNSPVLSSGSRCSHPADLCDSLYSRHHGRLTSSSPVTDRDFGASSAFNALTLSLLRLPPWLLRPKKQTEIIEAFFRMV